GGDSGLAAEAQAAVRSGADPGPAAPVSSRNLVADPQADLVCGLPALRPPPGRHEWVPASEADHGRLDADLRQCLLAASARTPDRLLAPWRGSGRRRGGTRPGSLLRRSIPIRGEWTEEGPGWLELDTVALCGGVLDDRHL
ncbi:MAG: hypothetical protein WHU94_15265, partial [Thermogemmata sp.]